MIPLILIPGMMCDARLFAHQIAALSARHDIILATMAHHNQISAIAGAILANAPQKFALCGLSMGGIVAMEMLRQAPDRVQRIALLDTNPLAELDDIKKRRIAQMQAVQNGALRKVMREELKPNYLCEGPLKTDIMNLCLDMALDLGPQVFVQQSQALMDRRDQTATLSAAAIPALVLCGREDRLCPVERHELMAALLPDARLRVIENAGHLPTLEQPEKTTKALKDWLKT